MELNQILTADLNKVESFSYIPKKTIGLFRLFIDRNTALLRADNIPHHICSFFLPIHTPSQSIYLVHHRKAQDWIPPGGHIDPDESPLMTVTREFAEELSYHLKNEQIILNNLTVKHIRSKRHPCKTHYDFWHTVEMRDLYHFVFDPKEFYEAGWFPFYEGLKKMKLPLYRNALSDSITPLFKL